jgi:protein-tyrosine kinase
MNRTSSEPVDLVERLAQRINLNADTPAPPQEAPLTPAYVDLGSYDEPTPEETSPTIHRLEAQRLEAQRHNGRAFEPNDDIPSPSSVTAELVTLDLDDLRTKGFLTPQSPHALLAEEYRIIKRPLMRAAFNIRREGASGRDHVVLVTSPQPGEGKTFTSINLGVSIASEPDFHVLLVDADVRQRGLSRRFGVVNRKGLTDVIRDPEMSLADVIVRTNIPNLSVLPAGQTANAPTEMLASQRAQDLIGEMTRRYADRFIIFDSPPVLAASEPGVLASYAGQVILVSTASETPKQALAESLTLLDTQAEINFILNRVTLPASATRFGHYGYYGED